MTASQTIRCALYVRVSTEQQVDGNSLATQESQLLRYAKARGYTIADIYVDAGLSAKDVNRPELQRLLEDAGGRRFDMVLVWAVDRISRSLPDLLQLIDTFREHGVEFAAVSQQFDTSDPAGLLTLHILGSFAQFERELMIERTKEGHLRRLHRSDWSCGVVPFGYRKEDGELIEVPEEANLVRRMFRLYLECRTYHGVATQLNEEGARTRKGNHWQGKVIKGILINPVYTGANVYGRHAKGDTRLKPREEWTVVPGMREPLVAPEVFEAVQKQVEATAARRKPRQPTGPYLLSGLLRCGKCGSPMYGKAIRSRGKVHRYYICNANTHLGKEVCEGTSVPADRLQEMIVAKVRDVFAGTEQSLPAQAAEKEKEEDAAAAEERRRLQNALERVKYRITRVFELYEMGELDKAAFKERMEKLSAEREAAQGVLGALRVQPADPIRSDTSEVSCGSLDDASGREFLRAVVREIIVQGTTVELVLADLDDQGDTRFTVSVLPDLDTTTLGGRLKKARLEAGLHQQDVADLLGVHIKCISNWENGRTRPRWLSIEEIEDAIAAG